MPYLNTIRVHKAKRVPYKTDNGIKNSKVYGSITWRQMRLNKLQQQPLCECCLSHNTITPAEQVHHKHPFLNANTQQEMYDYAFDFNNLMSVCTVCHKALHIKADKYNLKRVDELTETEWNEAHRIYTNTTE